MEFWPEELGKADTPGILDDILESLDFTVIADVLESFIDGVSGVYSDSWTGALLQVGADVAEDLVNRVNEDAIKWATEHAAELVSFDDDVEGSIVDATRDMIRKTLTDGMEENLSSKQIGEKIAEAYEFSEERGQLIAMTEIANANSSGALQGYLEAAEMGIKIKKGWLILEDACLICQANADEGTIPLDQEFSSGHQATPAHPKCRCVTYPEVED